MEYVQLSQEQIRKRGSFRRQCREREREGEGVGEREGERELKISSVQNCQT